MNRKLTLETLDVKAVPAAGPATPVGITLNSFGVLQIKGDGRDDAGRVWIEDGQVHATLEQIKWINQGNTQIPIAQWAPEKVLAANLVKSISFHGDAGNDAFTNDTGLPSTAFGNAGDDVLVGGFGIDKFYGGDDADRLEGGAGDDDLRGGAGSDRYVFDALLGRGNVGLGADTIDEDPNADADALDFDGIGLGITVNLGTTSAQAVKGSYLTLTLTDAAGLENVRGTAGNDNVTGNARPNLIEPLGGDDTATGAAGDDRLWGGDGNDRLLGGSGKNHVLDGAGDDLIDLSLNSVGVTFQTGGGNDEVRGSPFNDVIGGSSGNDTLSGNGGNDKLSGWAGNDVLVGGTGTNTILDGTGNDEIDYTFNAVGVTHQTGGGNDAVIGTSKNDVLRGSVGNDVLYGRGGNDRLFGSAGTDTLYGESGNDWLEAGTAAESADGGSGVNYNAHRWAIGGTASSDIRQTGAATCVFLSSLAGGAAAGIDLGGRVTYLGDFQYKVRLYNADSETHQDVVVTFDGTIAMTADGDWYDPASAAPGEFWTLLYQRAYMKMMAVIDENYKDPDYAMYAVTGRDVSGMLYQPAMIQTALGNGAVITAGNADQTNLIFDNHSYTVLAIWQSGGDWRIRLRNPWGEDGGTQTWGDPNDGIIEMTWDDFVDEHDFDRLSVS